MNKYIKKNRGGSYIKRGYYRRKFKLGKCDMQDLMEIYLPINWKCEIITYKNN